MSDGRSPGFGDSLISALKISASGDGAQSFAHLVLYTSFGVVRGRTGLSFAREVSSYRDGETDRGSSEVIELHDATVEHHSNHLPTASFDRLYVRLSDVRGFAIVNGGGPG